MRVYSLFDRKVMEYMSLVLGTTDEAVMRALAESFGTPSASTVFKYPQDFDLMRLGDFDPETGVITPEMPPRLVVNVSDILVSKEV